MRRSLLLLLTVCAVLNARGLPQSVITTYAGGGPTGGPALQAAIVLPESLAVDDSGNVLISAQKIFKVDATGTLSVVADIVVSGLAVDSRNGLLFSDQSQDLIRRLDLGTGQVSTVAGNGVRGFTGDGGPATAASLDLGFGVVFAIDAAGNLFFSDGQGMLVRRVDGATGLISTIVSLQPILNGSTGISSLSPEAPDDLFVSTNFCYFDPEGLCFPLAGSVFRTVGSSWQLTRIAGIPGYSFGSDCDAMGDGGPALSALFDGSGILGLAVRSHDLLIVDGCAVRAVDLGTGIISRVVKQNGSSIALDARRNIYLIQENQVTKVDPSGASVTRFAGTGSATFGGDNGPADNATLTPQDVVVDGVGNLFIADSGNNRIRGVDASGNVIRTVAGNGQVGSSGDGGPATSASFTILGITSDSGGNIFFSDQGAGLIRRVDSNTGLISTVAGSGSSEYGGDGGPALDAGMIPLGGLAVDHSGNLYIAADDDRIRRVDAATGIINTIAGTESLVGRGIALDGFGNLYMADNLNFRVHRVDANTGSITTVAGNGIKGTSGDGGLATNAGLNYPIAVTVDLFGNLFIADGRNPGDEIGGQRIRRVDAVTGIITTFAGTGTAGFSGDNGDPELAMLHDPTGVTIDGAGNLYIADSVNARVRRVHTVPAVTFSNTALAFGKQSVNSSGSPQVLTITNTGLGQPLTIAGIAITGDFAQSSSTCGAALSSGQSCGVRVMFQPVAAGARYGSLTIKDSAPGIPQAIGLFGLGMADFTLSITSGSSTSATVVAGQTAQYMLSLTPQAFKGVIGLACSGAPPKGTCSVSPSSATLDGTSPFAVTVTVTTTGEATVGTLVEPRTLGGKTQMSWLLGCGFLMLGAMIGPGKGVRKSAIAAGLFLVLLLTGCGGGANPPDGTPVGSYTITVTATSGTLSHATALTLMVK